MTFLLFLAALLGIVVFAVIVNAITGTKASYLETLRLEPGETELWRDTGADFATRPRTGQALVMTYARLRKHTVVWTERRAIVARKTLFSNRRMITHQIVFDAASAPAGPETQAATEFSGGFYGRGFVTLLAAGRVFGQVNQSDCVRIRPSEASGAASNVEEAYVFTDLLIELERSVSAAGRG
jgi:hypothetical protein